MSGHQGNTHPLRAVQLALLLLVSGAVCVMLLFLAGGSVASGENSVSCAVTQSREGDILRNVNVQNTGTGDVWIRVKLLTYRENAQGQRIGGTAAIPAFPLGEGWFALGAFYYYRYPVAAGQMPACALIGAEGITLAHYDDADGGSQVIEVMADAHPANRHVTDAWGVRFEKSEAGITIAPLS